ncbi:LytR/AlgR family response regulator transcription factor [Cyclobacterium jeungdonense]|uniref:LytTR family transcriptional regulator DNA-binding domain-containing protein n=1 Tax=Cyclobacterium jeungdonense TaxID=708087 RepID=A0ABT8C8U4_9BACT|nr:LytTR family transcriptional regulator DNA-binding domain-containing protein [Cyclobacterium jeungdonense]MDN3688787.1 LytTR family transcriptional regulator DNA-binding domain-containing protein [Cyclobacterium jeungdonense]
MIKILILEDDLVQATHLAQSIRKLGYSVTGIENNGEKAVQHFQQHRPELVLVDIGLNGKLNGIEAVTRMQEIQDVKAIFLTGNSGPHYFEEAKSTHPFAFITKPFHAVELQRTLDLAAEQIQYEREKPTTESDQSATFLKDRIFVRTQNKLVKILFDDIYYVEADRNYAKIHTKNESILVVYPLKVLEQKLPKRDFIRIHRSFLVNITKLDAVADTFLEINKKKLPISKQHKQELLNNLNTLS